ncbi:MAG: ubiquinol-cytochrome c reductase iron-sulfur subunit [Candidatus Aminicenantales bacterium]
MRRRNFVNFLLGGGIIGTIITFLYPVIRYIIPPKQSQAGVGQVRAAKVGELAPNSSKIFRFGNSPGILIHTTEGEMLAFSAVCTHLTCTVLYEEESGTILCPCHNGRFDLGGNVISGPPPSPLEAFDVEISGEDIIVSRKA